MGIKARAEYYPGFVRLHVLAEDDSDQAQSLKLKVRDVCLEYARTLLRDCKNDQEAWTLVNDHLEDFALIGGTAACDNGFEGEVYAETGVFEFPDRKYGDVIVPAGDYRALRIKIGEGTGKNWWCVLYPSLCMPENYEPDMEVTFYSAVGRWFQKAIGGEYK